LPLEFWNERQIEGAGIKTDDGRPAPWKRFFVHDPFGNRIEIREPGSLRTWRWRSAGDARFSKSKNFQPSASHPAFR
jgi:hypothetical protein